MDIFVYGGLAHANPKKKPIYDSWAQHETVFTMIEFDFVLTLLQVLNTLEAIKKLNIVALQELQTKTA